MLENGLEIFIWIGRSVSPNILASIFGVPSLDAIGYGKVLIFNQTYLPKLDNPLNMRLLNLIASIRETRLRQATLYPSLCIVREDGDPTLRMRFLSFLIEDRIENTLSYPQFLATIREKVQKS